MKLDKKLMENMWNTTSNSLNLKSNFDYSRERLDVFAQAISLHSMDENSYLKFTDLFFLNVEYGFMPMKNLVKLIDTRIVRIYTGKNNLLDLGGIFKRTIYNIYDSSDKQIEEDIDENGFPPIFLTSFPKLERIIEEYSDKVRFAILSWVIHKRNEVLVGMLDTNKFKKHFIEFQREFEIDVKKYLAIRGVKVSVYEDASQDIGIAYKNCIEQTQFADSKELSYDAHEIMAAIYFQLRIMKYSHQEISGWLPKYFYTLIKNDWNCLAASNEIRLDRTNQYHVNEMIESTIQRIDTNKLQSVPKTLETISKYLKVTKSVGSHLGYYKTSEGFNKEKLMKETYPKIKELVIKNTKELSEEIHKFAENPKVYLS